MDTGSYTPVALATYRYLRAGMAVMIVMLGAGIIGEAVATRCWQTSISAYFYTPVHSIFVAAVVAIGAQLVVYQGSNDTEDVVLNLAGVLALVVAVVPTSRPLRICGGRDLFAGYDRAFTVGNNVWALIIALAAAAVLSLGLHRRTATRPPVSILGMAARIVLCLFVFVGVVGLVWFRDGFDRYAHGVAAVSMFLAIIITVWITAGVVRRRDAPHAARYYIVYQTVAAAMLSTTLAVVVLHCALDSWNHAVLVIEALLIAEFVIYWLVQTFELWTTPVRLDPGRPRAEPLDKQLQPSTLAEVCRQAVQAPRGERLARLL